jgi:hypothetical protein
MGEVSEMIGRLEQDMRIAIRQALMAEVRAAADTSQTQGRNPPNIEVGDVIAWLADEADGSVRAGDLVEALIEEGTMPLLAYTRLLRSLLDDVKGVHEMLVHVPRSDADSVEAVVTWVREFAWSEFVEKYDDELRDLALEDDGVRERMEERIEESVRESMMENMDSDDVPDDVKDSIREPLVDAMQEAYNAISDWV